MQIMIVTFSNNDDKDNYDSGNKKTFNKNKGQHINNHKP